MQISDLTNLHSTKLAGKIAPNSGGNSEIALATTKRVACKKAALYTIGRRQAESNKAVSRSSGRTWASDLKGRDIRVKLIAPSAVVMPGYKSELGMSDRDIEQYLVKVAYCTPSDHAASANEMAEVMSFLCSGDARYIAGAEIEVNG